MNAVASMYPQNTLKCTLTCSTHSSDICFMKPALQKSADTLRVAAVYPRKLKGGIACGSHLAIMHGGEFLNLQIFFVGKPAKEA